MVRVIDGLIIDQSLKEGVRTFQGDDLARWIHDGRICRYGSPDGVGGVGEVDDDHLVRLAHLFADAYELVRLHGERREADV